MNIEYTFALLLIITPNIDTEEYNINEYTKNNINCIRYVARKLELSCHREGFSGDVYKDELDIYRARWEELKDAPNMFEANKWNDEVLYSNYSLATRYSSESNYLFEYAITDKAREFYKEQYLEAEYMRLFWSEFTEITPGYGCSIYSKRKTLKSLKEKLGDKMFYSGELPPALPIKYLMVR